MTLVGREHEREVLRDEDRRALLLRGGPGAGKSALLDDLAVAAAGAGSRVVRATGVQAERALPYAGLQQVVHPLRGDGLLDGTPSVIALGVAVLDLLATAAAPRPLLVIVDDGQWLDAPSAQVLTFVARRLGDLPVRMVIAVRDDFEDTGLPELVVPPLSARASAALLDERFPDLGPELRELTLEHAGGNPLALVELPPSLSEHGPDPDGHVPLPRRLERLFAGRIRALPDSERAELLRMALDGAGRQRTYGAQYAPGDVTAAREAGLVDDGQRAFRHPLVGSAVVQLASPNERRAAHTALAVLHAADIERRAVHLAAATVDPDPAVAAALEEAARTAIRRGGSASAVPWLTRAAELSPRPADRARLLADAAFVAGQAGLLDRAEILVAAADRADGRIASPDAVLTAAYVALYRHGDVAMHGIVAGVIRARHADLDDAMLARLLNLLLAISQFAADPVVWADTDALVDRLRERMPDEMLLRRDAWSDVVRRGTGLAARLRVLVTEVAEPWDLMRLGVAAFHLGTLGDIRPYLVRTVERERAGGAATSVMTMLQLVMLDHITAGRWDDAVTVGRDGLALTEVHGHDLFGYQFRAFLGLVAAGRGDAAEAGRRQAQADGWARGRRVGFLLRFAEEIGLLAALTGGDYETAWSYAIGIAPPGEFPPYAQHAPRTLLDLVEAGLHTGRDTLARTHAVAADRARLADVSPRFALLVAGALAMTGPSEQAFAAAANPDFPFEHARIRLAEAAWHRRHRRVGEGRAALTEALAVFDRLGARPWADRARNELALGLPGDGRDRVTSLTAQERNIAELAATGLSNKQIGAQLFLSPRTVGAHLYRIFPKLGITSRAALRDALVSSD